MKNVIVGCGVAGVEAAMEIRRRDQAAEIVLVGEEKPFYYSKTALMYLATDPLLFQNADIYEPRFFSDRGIKRVFARAGRIDHVAKLVHLENGETLPYDRALIAVGAMPSTFGWPGLELNGVVNMTNQGDVEKIRSLAGKAKKAVVVGGGLIGCELCEVLRDFGLSVTFLIRDGHFWPEALSFEEARFVEEEIARHGVKIVKKTNLKRIVGENGIARAIETEGGETIEADIVGIATGVKPDTRLAAASDIPVKRGVLTDDQCRTRVPGIYAAGDCMEMETQNGSVARAIWYFARKTGRLAGANMTGAGSPYEEETWYNSAKFFELEYTSIGRYNAAQGDQTFLYQDGNHSVKAVYNNDGLQGFSLIGSRWDSSVLAGWIASKRSVDDFRRDYRQALYQPEFTKNLRIA